MSSIDYGRIFDAHWSRPGVLAAPSSLDAAELARRVLTALGGGATLDVGCGIGQLVYALLRHGVDARGIDVSSAAIAAAQQRSPGRFEIASALKLPHADESSDNITSIDMLQHLDEPDISFAIAELHRICRRGAFIVINTQPDPSAPRQPALHDRAWWEHRFFQAGFRRHPRMQTIIDFESLERDPPHITLILEKIPAAAHQRWPLSALAAERMLHMDMQRESGRRSDAHIARYILASRFVRPGDTILDAACGLGYGAAVLAANTDTTTIIGVDNSDFAIAYAAANYAATYPSVRFQAADLSTLAFLHDGSIDVIVSMETLEHLANPAEFLRECRRVLRPSGRAILSVPNQWVDETGKDPNPHHLHVYDFAKLKSQVAREFLVEFAFLQIAGGGMKLTDRPRRIAQIATDPPPTAEAEWWLMVGMKDPIGATRGDYRETVYPEWANSADCHIAAFGRDYDNPWLVRSMISIGLRSTNPALLEDLANRVLATARNGSADQGAALCVRAYRLLDNADHGVIRDHVERITKYIHSADHTAHAWRWCISNEYVAALLLMAIGERDGARAAFERCAAMDPLKFSPLLATKTVDAHFQAGRLYAADNRLDRARTCWESGLRETHRVLQGDWKNIWGVVEHPATFGMPEVAQLADLAARCSFSLAAIARWSESPGRAWHSAHTNTQRELDMLRHSHQELARACEWFESQRASWQKSADDRQQQIVDLRAWIADREAALADLRHRFNDVEAARQWSEENRLSWLRRAEENERTIQQLRAWAEQRDAALQWAEGQRAAYERNAATMEAAIQELKSALENRHEAVSWLEQQLTNWKLEAQRRERTIEELRGWANELMKAKESLEAQLRGAAQRIAKIGEVPTRD